MLALSRPPLCSSPLPSRTSSPRRSERATSASACALTIAARSFASSPSGRRGNASNAMSVTTRPRTESPRNSSRSFVVSRPCSNANERCVNAVSRSSAFRKRIPSARSNARGSERDDASAVLTPSLDLDDLPARVEAAVAADPVRELRLVALRALGVRGWLRLPVRRPLVTSRLALLLLGNRHRSSFLFLGPYLGLIVDRCFVVAQLVEQHVQPLPPGIDPGLPAGASPQVQVTAAPSTQASAVRPAHRGEGQLDADDVADHLLRLQEPLGVHRVLVGVLVWEEHEELLEVDREAALELAQAAGTPELERPLHAAAREDAFDQGLEDELSSDRGVLRKPGELRLQVVQRAGQLLHLGRARASHEVADVDRPDHGPSSSSKRACSCSGWANSASAAVAGPRSRSRPTSTWSRVRVIASDENWDASRIFRIEISNCASFAST